MLIDHSPRENLAQPAAQLAPVAKNERVRRALLLMEQHIADPMPVEAIAKQIKISARQLARDFHDELGAGPARVNLNLRLEHARMRLAASAIPITEVAHLSGFPDAAYFTKQFRAQFGQTPRKYRQSVATV